MIVSRSTCFLVAMGLVACKAKDINDPTHKSHDTDPSTETRDTGAQNKDTNTQTKDSGVENDDTGVETGDPDPGEDTDSNVDPVSAAGGIGLGRAVTCAVDDPGSLRCWGGNIASTLAPSGPWSAIDVEPAGNAVCAIGSNDAVYCWGSSVTQAVTGVVVKSLDIGNGTGCGLDALGSPVCWSYDGTPAPAALPTGAFAGIAVDGSSACLWDASGVLSCIGPVAQWTGAPTTAVQSVALSNNSACAALVGGGVHCWHSGVIPLDPVQNGMPTGLAVDLAIVADGGCAVMDHGGLSCWGDAAFVTSPPAGTWSVVKVSPGHACAVDASNQSLDCWGSNAATESDSIEATFEAVDMGGVFRCVEPTNDAPACWNTQTGAKLNINPAASGLSVGVVGVCGLVAGGAIACWSEDLSSPLITEIPTGTFAEVSVGGSHACARTSTGAVSCWGESFGSETTPPPTSIEQLSLGIGWSCGLASDGTITVWGDDTYGQLTDAPTGMFAGVACGGYHGCAWTATGDASCWGFDGGTYNYIQVPTGSWNDFVTDAYGTCGVRADGAILCWGAGTWSAAKPPDGPLRDPSVGLNSVCALDEMDRLTCWGSLTRVP